jgi:pimeloyl-ACP methyl ester carboxylesterase
MKRTLKIFGVALLGVIALLGLLIAGGLAYRAYRQHQNSDVLPIRAANGIEEAMFVEIGGLRQWIQIRGEDRGNPVLLFVHGGPALSMIPFTYRSMRPWEKYFTIVQWDQRGAGRTYLLNGGADSTASGMAQIVDDGIRVCEYLRMHLHKDKIVVVGESWGSGVALEMARLRPDLFDAFVGTGQMIDMRRAQGLTYKLLLERVRAEGDSKALKQLMAIGPPPYPDRSTQNLELQILGAHPAASERAGVLSGMSGDFLFAPGYSLAESSHVLFGATRARSRLADEAEGYNAAAAGLQFKLPVFFFQGSDDIQAPTQLVAQYMRDLEAPRKELVMFAGGGHNTYYFFADPFLVQLRERVRPLAVPAAK